MKQSQSSASAASSSSAETNQKPQPQAFPINTDSILRLTNFGESGIDITDEERYKIVDLELKDVYGIVQQTVSITTLYPGKTTRGHHHDKGENYHFTKGSGYLLMQSPDYTRFYKIEPETWQYIPGGIWHMIMNPSNNEDLEFTTVYNGKSARPPIDKLGDKKK